MTVGLPGTGIGGLFYLLSALAMPLSATVRTFRDRKQHAHWRVALAQFGLGATMLAVLVITGIVIDQGLAISSSLLADLAPSSFGQGQTLAFGVLPTFVTLSILCFVLILIEIIGAILFITDKTRTERRPRRPVTAEHQHVTS